MVGRCFDWLNETRGRRWAAATVCGALIALGAAMAVAPLLRPEPPDPATAAVEQVVDFLASEQFASMDSRWRQDYLSRFGRRYAHMNAAERDALSATWDAAGLDRRAKRQLEEQLGLSMARQVVQRYQELSPEQREAYLDRVAAMVSVMPIGRRAADSWFKGENPVADSMRNQERFSRDITDFKRDLVDQTTAPERAAMSQVGRQIIERLNPR